MADESQLDGLIDRLRGLDRVGVAIAEDALPRVLAAARATASSGTTPDGKPWAPKKDGTAALPNAAAAISAEVSGTTKAVITLVAKGPYRFHQRSKSTGKKGLPRREVLPVDAVPAAISDAIQASAKRIVARRLGAR